VINSWNAIISFDEYLAIHIAGMRASSNTSSANILTILQSSYVNLNYSDTDIIALQFLRHTPANGYKVEVYKA